LEGYYLWCSQIPLPQQGIYRALQLLQELGLSVNPGFIMFDAHTTVEELEHNRAFLRSCATLPGVFSRMELRFASKMMPYVGTAIRSRYAEEHRLHSDDLLSDAFDDYTFEDPCVEALCATMRHWQSATAPVRRLCWDLALEYSPSISARARPLLDELASLTMSVFESALSASQHEPSLWACRCAVHWPSSFDEALNTLASKALSLHDISTIRGPDFGGQG
jgi:hypothetical protein